MLTHWLWIPIPSIQWSLSIQKAHRGSCDKVALGRVLWRFSFKMHQSTHKKSASICSTKGLKYHLSFLDSGNDVFEIFESVSGRCIQIVPQHFSIHLARIRWPGSRNAWQCLLTLPSKPWHFTSMLLVGPLSRPPRLSSKSEHGRARAGGRRQIGGPGCY